MLSIFHFVLAGILSFVTGCREDLETVTYRNGSLVYCNPNPEKFTGSDPYARFPVCGPEEACEYRWMGLYSCCKLPDFPRKLRLFSPLINKISGKIPVKKNNTKLKDQFQLHRGAPTVQSINGANSIADIISQITEGGGDGRPSGYTNNNGAGGFLPGPSINLPTFPGPIPTAPNPISIPNPTRGVYGPGPSPVGGNGIPFPFVPGPPAPRPRPVVSRPRPAPPVPPRPAVIPRPFIRPAIGTYIPINNNIFQNTPPPPFRPPPPPTFKPTPVPRTIPPFQNPGPTYGSGNVRPLAPSPVGRPYRPPQQPQPVFDNVWNQAPIVPWIYEAQLPPGLEVINIKCVIQSDIAAAPRSAWSSRSVHSLSEAQRPEIKHPPQRADEQFFKNRLPLCPRGVSVLRRTGGQYRAVSRRHYKDRG